MQATLSPLPARETATIPALSRADRQRLLQIAHRFLGCHHLAEDALQDVLIDLSRQTEAPDRPVGWLARAIIHRCRHMRRTLRRRAHHEHIASQHCRWHGDCENPLHISMAHELGERLAEVRDALPTEQQTVLELFTAKRKNYQEISDLLGVPIGTVRSRLARARAALQEKLQMWKDG